MLPGNSIIVSRHPDAYSRIAKSVWDGLIWTRDHCSKARFAGKFDPDAIVFLGNLVNYLRNAPTKRYYGGRKLSYYAHPRDEKRSSSIPWIIRTVVPSSLCPDRRLSFLWTWWII